MHIAIDFDDVKEVLNKSQGDLNKVRVHADAALNTTATFDSILSDAPSVADELRSLLKRGELAIDDAVLSAQAGIDGLREAVNDFVKHEDRAVQDLTDVLSTWDRGLGGPV